MANNPLYTQSTLPTFSGEESSREMIEAIMNYLQDMEERMRYLTLRLSDQEAAAEATSTDT